MKNEEWTTIAAYLYIVSEDPRKPTDGKQKAVYVRETPLGEFVLVRLDAVLQNDELGEHQHKLIKKRHPTIVEAMRAAEEELGPGGRWAFASQLYMELKRGAMNVNVTINNAGPDELVLTVAASPKRGTEALDDHTHVFRRNKSLWALMDMLTAAVEEAITTAKCTCGPIPETKRRPRKAAAKSAA